MPSIHERLAAVQPNTSSKQCKMCAFWELLKPPTKKLINDWIDAGHSLSQLHDVLCAPGEEGEPRLDCSITGFRMHMKHHTERCRDN